VNVSTPPASESVATPPDAWIGRVIDERYEIVEKLGEGGMGSVYVGEHLKLHKRVALKVIHPEFAGDGEVAARFAREAMASAQLDHPHIASAMDYGTLPEGGTYLVMQLVKGSSLQDLMVEEGAMAWQKACEVAAQVADALATAHEVGIVHRDLKPDNILLTPREDKHVWVKVLDFGIARVPMENRNAPAGAEPGKALTRVGTVMGTPGYMAPEQAMGEVVDARADVYSLGVVLWEMLTGRNLFETRDLTAIVTAQLTEPPPPVAQAVPHAEIPTALDTLVQSMLASAPDKRPDTAASVRDALRHLVYGTGHGPSTGQHAVGKDDAGRPGTDATARTMWAGPSATGRATAPSLSEQLQSLGTTARTHLRRIPLPFFGIGAVALLLMGGVALGGWFLFGTDDDTPGAMPRVSLPSLPSLPTLLGTGPAAPEEEVPPEVAERVTVMLQGADRRDRRRAAQWIIDHEPADDVPAWIRGVAELEMARGCDSLEAAIAKIVEAGDPRALPTLHRYARSPRRGCGFLDMSDCYSCIRPELRDAIRGLEGVLDAAED